jgi:nucleoside phosphorylase
MSISVIDVAMIAQGLRVRQKLQVPTLLFLGARAGALFHSQTLYDELRPFSQDSFATFDQIEKFQACVHLLAQDRFSDTEIHSILLRSLPDVFVQNIDRYVAALAKLNFYRLIVTTSINAGLEAALSWIGLRKNNDFDVFIPGTSSSSSVPSLSSEHVSDRLPLFTLVKLYGELAMGQYSLKRRGKLIESNTQHYQQLRSMRNWNILMVGFDPVWDAAIVPILFPCAGKLWYVNEETPSYDSEVFKYLQLPNAQCLLGVKGSSEKFFQSLYQHIVGSAPLPSLASPEEPASAKSRLFAPPPATGKVEQSVLRAKSPLTTHYKADVLLLATTERELTAVLKKHYGDHTKRTMQGRTCYDLGKVRDASVSLVQADEMGNALNTLSEQIQELSPACIIILGMAWGFKYKGQYIGNLVVSDRVLIYDVEQESNMYKLNVNLSSSAYLTQGQRDQHRVPTRLLNLFKNGSIILNRKTKRLVPVTFGPVFASTKPVDQQAAFRFVSRAAPDVIGIEPDGAALFSIAQNYQENCLLVKGISALVDNTVDQGTSDTEGMLEKAADFILQVIALGGFHDPQAQ